MALMRRPSILGKKKASKNALIVDFLKDTQREDFPHLLALNTLKELESSSKSQEDFFLFLIEDIIFASIYATIHEEFFASLKNNPQHAAELVDHWQNKQEKRDHIIASLAQSHLNFITNNGLCSGCQACDNHSDISELMPYFQKGDITFFINLYMGMQTIQIAMEQLLYDSLLDDPSLIEELSKEKVSDFRKFLYNYSEERKV